MYGTGGNDPLDSPPLSALPAVLPAPLASFGGSSSTAGPSPIAPLASQLPSIGRTAVPQLTCTVLCRVRIIESKKAYKTQFRVNI